MILCWRVLWKPGLASMLALKSTSMDASHGKSKSLLWCHLMVNMELTRNTNACAVTVLWTAVSRCLKWLAQCLCHPRTSWPCWSQRHTCCFCTKYSALPCLVLPCPAWSCPALPGPALPWICCIASLLFSIRSIRSPVSVVACCEDVFVVPLSINMKLGGSFNHFTCVFP